MPKDATPNLWSSNALLSDIESVKRVHASYLHAGAKVLSTCTYQLTLQAAGSEQKARILMKRAINALHEATRAYNMVNERLLSLGPAATIHPSGAEYSGEYRGPFDPKSATSTAALTDFHLSRLRLVEREDWDKLDGILFETVPLVTELDAIRAAVGHFQIESPTFSKPIYISMVFPNGRLPEWPQSVSVVDGMASIVRSAFEPCPDRVPIHGLGINCTHPRYISHLVRALDDALRGIDHPPQTLLLYPDGGSEWTGDTFGTALDVEVWADFVMDAVRIEGSWARVLVGGCCNTGPQHITELYNRVIKLA